ncbi:serine/threonine-protein kinase pelle [Anastrepha obliqua]|uniref:serine/threonine-protein kinase pelle n=1 Tax=Anastrepha obliqua TaxID=95512 RepID=UPI002409EA49|nr:serine/threonine-protein kinase pelle [Anastrepha obliqua]XP_054741362.1 serine/threonine-protein kinase pelle [Anastrepha obliqua]XP_054741363.1 serine/threonine-protein kinase pelle [Anastrepha obliqua]
MSVSRSRSALSPNNSITNGNNSGGSGIGVGGGGSSSSSSGYVKDRYIHELPLQQLRLLCEHLDEMQIWKQLAEIMQLRPADVKFINQQQELGKSPSWQLIQKWGIECKHTVTELFMLLWKKEQHHAMRMLKDFVERKYQLLIPRSQPRLTMLMAANSDIKQLNGPINTSSSGVSNSNNNTSYSSYEQTGPTSTQRIERDVREFARYMIEISYDELTEATENWSDRLKLGRGGFGTVYKGTWKCTEVAVKQLQYNAVNGRDSSKVQLQQSLNELKHLSRYRHDNVLPLFGYSLNGDKPCLVYQLMKGGTLEQRLYSKKETPLTWEQRVEICLGAARGINFLHVCDVKPLIHGDIKPANVLLDVCLTPRIGDFGLAREGPAAVSRSVTVSQIYGTKPYLPQEFLRGKKLSTKVDTYSYGVMLLEAFTGLRAVDHNRKPELLAEYIKGIRKDELGNLIDARQPIQNGERDMCKNLILLGTQCVAFEADDRPEMEYVYDTIRFCKIYPD